MQPNLGRFEDTVRQVVIKTIFDTFANHRQTVFCMPGNVKIDLAVYGVGHIVEVRTLKRPVV
jgi:hypothetical protein